MSEEIGTGSFGELALENFGKETNNYYWHKFLYGGTTFYVPINYTFDFLRKYPEAEDLGPVLEIQETEVVSNG